MLILLADGCVVAAAAVQPQPVDHAAGTAGRELPGQRGRAQQETGPAGVDTVLENLSVDHPDPDDGEVHLPTAGNAGALLGTADKADPQVRPHPKVEQGGGIRAGHHLIRPRRIGPAPASDRHPVLVNVEAMGAGDGGRQLHVRQQDRAELPA